MGEQPGLERQEVEATLEARRELGPSFEPALVDAFADKVERAIAARVDAQTMLLQRDRWEESAHGKRQLALGIVSLVFSVPVTAITLNSGPEGGSILVTVVAWGGIATINLAHAWRRGGPRGMPPGMR